MCEISDIKKIYPSILELTTIEKNLKCNENGCNRTFNSSSNLSMHIQKHHKLQNLEKKSDFVRHFHCPEQKCTYHAFNHFKMLKYLKQHYLKMHADKRFVCVQCEKGFSTENMLNKHVKICGFVFKCGQCSCKYTSKESLLTHYRRKKHHEEAEKQIIVHDEKSNKLLLPKPLNLIPIIVQVKTCDNNRADKQIQTDLTTTVKKSRTSLKRKNTQQTQTYSRKKVRKSTETQTIGDYILKKSIQDANIDAKCIETQTKDTTNEIYNFLMHSSSSQTNFDNLNYIFEDSAFGNCNSQTQTDLIDDFLQSHIETQTSSNNNDESLDLYNQTNENQLLSALEFTNIETQTNWPDYDMFVSTETQTLLSSHCTKSVLDLALSSRETQTDMELFKQLLEEINA